MTDTIPEWAKIEAMQLYMTFCHYESSETEVVGAFARALVSTAARVERETRDRCVHETGSVAILSHIKDGVSRAESIREALRSLPLKYGEK